MKMIEANINVINLLMHGFAKMTEAINTIIHDSGLKMMEANFWINIMMHVCEVFAHN